MMRANADHARCDQPTTTSAGVKTYMYYWIARCNVPELKTQSGCSPSSDGSRNSITRVLRSEHGGPR